ncbi:MAG: SCO family protein [Legionella sp.]|nr:SCO family protein [Legionella sp.]
MDTSHKKFRIGSLVMVFCVMVTGIFFYIFILMPQKQYYKAHHVNIQGTYLIKPITLKPFKCMDHFNKKFNLDNLRNRWTFIFFGFAHCKNICPSTLTALNSTLFILNKNFSNYFLPQVVFITVDPKRDTLGYLHEFICKFNPNFIGARATTGQKALEENMHVFTSKGTADDNGYTINHSAELVLINPDAKIQAYFSYPVNPTQLAKEYMLTVNKYQTMKGK